MDAVAFAMVEALPTTAPTVGWQTIGTVDGPTTTASAAVSTDGTRIYQSHGYRYTGQPSVTSQLFIVNADGTSVGSSSVAPVARQGVAGAWCNGKHYAIGGFNSGNSATSSVESYTPAGTNGASGVWSTQANLLGAARGYATAAVIGSYIYVAGGQLSLSDTSNAAINLSRYDTTTNTWTGLATLPAARTRGAMVAVGTKLYYFGGRDTSSAITMTVFIFDTVAGTWSTGTAMPFGAAAHAVAAVGNLVYILPGLVNSDIKNVYSYNVTTGATSLSTALTGSHSDGPGAVAIGSVIYLVSGTDTANVDRLDLGAGTGYTTAVLGVKSLLNPLLAGIGSALPATPPTDTTGKAVYAQTVQTLKALAAL